MNMGAVKHKITEEEVAKLAYVIASQGIPREWLLQGRFQPWVENVNRLLQISGFKTVLFCAGDLDAVLYSKERELKMFIDKKLSFLHQFFSISTIIRMLLGEKPHLVVVHGLQHFMTLAALLTFGIIRRTSMVIIIHGIYEAHDPMSSISDRIIRSLLRLLDRTSLGYLMLFLTHYDEDYLSTRWRLNSRATTVSPFPLYMNLEEAQALSKTERVSGETRDLCTFLYVGRLSPNKQVDRIILALHRILRNGHKAQLIIMGDGPLREQLSSLIEELGLKDVVKMPGVLLGRSKWKFYVKSDAVVLASKSEGLPRVIIEAFFAGKPVIVPDACGIPEVVKNDVNGFVFHDEDDLVQHMIQVIERRDLAEQLGVANKAMAREKMFLENEGRKDFENIIARLNGSVTQ